MARNGSEIGEPALILALAQGKSIAETAALSGLSERTVSRRMSSSGIRVLVSKTRLQMLNRGLGVLMTQVAPAAATLGLLLKSENEAVRLGAARSIIGETTRLAETVDIAERLTDVEQRLEDAAHDKRNGHA